MWLAFPQPPPVIDPRTGKHIFAETDREIKITVLPKSVPTPPPTLSPGRSSSVTARATHAVNLGMYKVDSSLASSRIEWSASRSLKKAKSTALLTLRIGEYVVKTQVV